MENNLIYKRQFAILMFILTFTYKVSRLPPLVSSEVGSSGTFLIFLYMLLEVAMFLIIYRFILIEGDEALKDNIIYKLLMLVLAVNFILKVVFAFAGTVVFALELLFENISKYEVIVTLILPISYMAYKGIRVIARTAEMFIWLIIIILLTNFIFIKINPDFSQNLPFLNGTFGELLKSGNKFFFWFGDFTPFIFLKLKSTKRNYIGLSFAVSFIMVIASITLMYAIYGPSAKDISNFIVKVASFNQFADKLGRLDWTGIIIWLIMSMIFLAVYLWAFMESGERLVKKRKFILAVGFIFVLVIEIIAKDMAEIIIYATKGIRWLAAFCNYIIPPVLLILAAVVKRKKAKYSTLEINNECSA